ARDRCSGVRRDLLRASPLTRIAAGREHVDDAAHILTGHIEHALQLRAERLRGTALQLHALSPLLTLGRGYAIVRREPGGEIVTSTAQVAPGQHLSVRVADGTFAAVTGPRLGYGAPDVAPVASHDVTPSRARAARRGAASDVVARPDTLGANEGNGDHG
ncbi:MAG TPA: exodeoxyribonuclease VII large subunit, partial [Ktedonobacterales bacterium]|nr:exodeoxyribonuclease VII large subunit [Ktedonobacterales bacterium]